MDAQDHARWARGVRSAPTTGDTENQLHKLPADFTIAPGAQRVVHFRQTGRPDHFAVNQYSLYYTDTNAQT